MIALMQCFFNDLISFPLIFDANRQLAMMSWDATVHCLSVIFGAFSSHLLWPLQAPKHLRTHRCIIFFFLHVPISGVTCTSPWMRVCNIMPSLSGTFCQGWWVSDSLQLWKILSASHLKQNPLSLSIMWLNKFPFRRELECTGPGD